MIYDLCKNIIKAGFESNSYMTKEMMELQIEMFKMGGKLTDTEYEDLKLLLNPIVEEPIIEE